MTKNHLINIFLVILIAGFCSKSKAQGCSTLNFKSQSDIGSVCSQMTMTMRPDSKNRPYLYVANKEAGLKIYEISNLTSPLLKQTFPVDSLLGLHVMNLSQEGNYLYIALGNHFTNSQSPGLAIIDVTDPSKALLKSVWKSSYSDGGSGVVKPEGNYVYLGAMTHGVMVFDVANKSNITFISEFKPDINFPTPKPNKALYNARGMVVKNDIIYLCYDAGGVRIINAADKKNMKETGRYCNRDLDGKPRAYNNLVLDDSLVYVAADYCGLEVLNVKDTSNITQVSWWNPWHCEKGGLTWFGSPGHANEIEMEKSCGLLFISTGKSDLHIIDVNNPKQPDSCNFYGGVSNNLGTWGVALGKGTVFLSYICAAIPFSSNWTGVKIISYNPCGVGLNEFMNSELRVINNYGDGLVKISGISLTEEQLKIEVFNLEGKRLNASYEILSNNSIQVNMSPFQSGIYLIKVIERNKVASFKVARN